MRPGGAHLSAIIPQRRADEKGKSGEYGVPRDRAVACGADASISQATVVGAGRAAGEGAEDERGWRAGKTRREFQATVRIRYRRRIGAGI